MNIYSDKMPTLWWLRPWHHARRLQAAANAINDRLDETERELGYTKLHANRCEDLLSSFGVTLGKPKGKTKKKNNRG